MHGGSLRSILTVSFIFKSDGIHSNICRIQGCIQIFPPLGGEEIKDLRGGEEKEESKEKGKEKGKKKEKGKGKEKGKK